MLSGFFVTKKGKNLLAKTHDGAHIKLTRAEIGNGDIPEGQLISDVTQLYGKIKDLGLNDVKMVSGNIACVPVRFTNKGILTSFELKEIGIYALDPDEGEILYLYGNTSATGDKPDEIKSESEAPLEYLFNLNLSFEDGTEVEVEVNNGIIYVTKQELIDMADTKVDKVNGKGLSTEDYTTAEKNKLAGIAAGANKYVHPSNHPMSMITGLGTAATKNTGTTAGNIPLIGSDGLLPTSVLPPPLIVENVLTSTSTVNALSAAQGKVLNDAKVDKVSGKGLSTNDYTTAEKNKLAGIAAGANNYVHPSTHPASMITGLGTAAVKDIGITSGQVPVIGAAGKLSLTILPEAFPALGGTADQVKNKLTAGSKAYDGSTAVTLTAADLGALTSIPTTYVTETKYATTAKGGVVKSSTAADKISVGTDGIMSVNAVSGSKVSGTVASATSATNAMTAANANKVANKLTAGSKAYDGSAAVTITAADLGASSTGHTHTKAQITDFPTSMPANGGNADTVGGKAASAFALASHSHAGATASTAGFMTPNQVQQLNSLLNAGGGYVTGTYIGDGKKSRSFSLGFRGSAIFIFPQVSFTLGEHYSSDYISMYFALYGHPSYPYSLGTVYKMLELTETGFSVFGNWDAGKDYITEKTEYGLFLNDEEREFRYIIFK